MAQPPPPATATVTIAIPMLDNIFQSVRHLEDELRNVSTRLGALELQLAQQTKQSPLNITDPPRDLVDDTTFGHEDLVHQEEDHINDVNLHVQIDDRLRRDDFAHTQQDDIIQEDENIITQEDVFTHTQEDNIGDDHEENVTHTQQDDITQEDEDVPSQEDDIARTQNNTVIHNRMDIVTHSQQDDITHTQPDDVNHEEEETVHDSSPSVDEGITVVTQPLIPQPAAAAAAAGGKKRKRTIHDAPAHIDRAGFMIRSSDARLAEKRNGEARGSSRSESPFAPARPPKAPARPQSPSSSKPKARPRRPKATEAGLDEFVAPKPEDFTISRTGRIRRQTKKPFGFVATPSRFE
ncbi:hypothetical protein KCU65_g9396, partial [Aureobasidium melanogenum]